MFNEYATVIGLVGSYGRGMDLDGTENIEAGLLQSQRQAPTAREQVNCAQPLATPVSHNSFVSDRHNQFFEFISQFKQRTRRRNCHLEI
jgi:hypothetical protein